MSTTKRCKACALELPLEKFTRTKYTCKQCINNQKRLKYHNDKAQRLLTAQASNPVEESATLQRSTVTSSWSSSVTQEHAPPTNGMSPQVEARFARLEKENKAMKRFIAQHMSEKSSELPEEDKQESKDEEGSSGCMRLM